MVSLVFTYGRPSLPMSHAFPYNAVYLSHVTLIKLYISQVVHPHNFTRKSNDFS